MPRLDNKVVLITGSTQGIGAAIARLCVQEGAKVMLHGRNEERAQELEQELNGQASYIIHDLAVLTAAKSLVEATIAKFGRIDVLINNAGIFPRNNIDTLTEEFYEWVMTVNLKVPMFLCQEAVAAFRKQGKGGNIVNIGSMNAHTGQTDLLVYSVSKGGMMTMTRNLGDALASEKIRVNQLNVGWTLTETERELKKSEGMIGDWESKLSHTLAPSGRLLRPEDIAHHAVFWASDDSAPVTGQIYEIEQYPIIGRNLINVIQECKND